MNLISLGIHKFEIAWNKHTFLNDFSDLFQSKDVKYVEYYYFDTNCEKIDFVMGKGLSKSLGDIKMRLDLLGYDIKSVENMYEDTKEEYECFFRKSIISFQDFYSVITNINLSKLNSLEQELECGQDGYDPGEYFKKCILSENEIRDRITRSNHNDQEVSNSDFEYEVSWFLESLDPYITLRLMAENPNNTQYDVEWRFLDYEGYNRHIPHELEPSKQIMIVTEGSSDSKILKKAIDELYPSISDFFCFIDMKDNYPFTGVGNLFNFCKGLCKIRIQNNVLVLFDNDTAGLEKYNESTLLDIPNSLAILRLPDYPDFDRMHTIGPQGEVIDNINGRAVSIECFLDFDSIKESPRIRWTSFNNHESKYQGELENKEEYTRRFLRSHLSEDNYNTKKLKFLVNYIISQWIYRETK